MNGVDRGRFSISGSEEEDQETFKEGKINFVTVELGHNLEDSRPESGTGKEEQN